MKSYNDIMKEEMDKSGIDNKCPEKRYRYAAYAKGTVTLCDTYLDASLISDNKDAEHLIEKICINEEEIDTYWERLGEIQGTANDLWYVDLREEWAELSDKMFGACYNMSYQKNHPYGNDAVANGMHSVVEFVKEIEKIVKEEMA